MKLLFSILVLGFFSWQANAQNVSGGHVVVCMPPNQPMSVRLLDFYEAELDGRSVDLGPAGLAFEKYGLEAVTRLQRLSPLRAQSLENLFNAFTKNVKLVPQLYIPVPEIITDISVPVNCQIRQMAYRANNDAASGLKLTIDLRYWNLLSEVDKAGLLIHEVLLSESSRDSQTNRSASARAVVESIATGQIDKINSVYAWNEFLYQQNFGQMDMCGAWGKMDKKFFAAGYQKNFWNEGGYLKEFNVLANYPVSSIYGSFNGAYKVRCADDGTYSALIMEGEYRIQFVDWIFDSLGREGTYGETLSFDGAGRIRSIERNNAPSMIGLLGYMLSGIYQIGLSATGQIISIRGSEDVYRNYDNMTFIPYAPTPGNPLKVYLYIDLYDDQRPQRVVLAEDAKLLDIDGHLKTFSAKSEVTLSHEGRVLVSVPVN